MENNNEIQKSIQEQIAKRRLNILKGFSEFDENKSLEQEEKEHSETYKELEEDAEDGKLDTTKKEFAEDIKRDHEN